MDFGSVRWVNFLPALRGQFTTGGDTTVGPGLSQEGAAQTEIEAHARPRSNLRSYHVPPTPRREHTQVATLHPASRRGIALQSCPHFSAGRGI